MSVVPVSRYLRIFVILWIPLVFLNGCKVLRTFMVTTAYKAADELSVTNLSAESFDANTYFNLFNSTCLNIVNNVAPLKIKHSIKKSAPWFNDHIHLLRRNCRQAERKWCKDRLQVSYDILKESLSIFQKAVKSAKFKFLSEIISENHHRPRVLFSTIDAVINLAVDVFPDVSDLLCENFVAFFVEKIARSRPQSLAALHIFPEITGILFNLEHV